MVHCFFHYEFCVRLENMSVFTHPFSVLIVAADQSYKYTFYNGSCLFFEDLVKGKQKQY